MLILFICFGCLLQGKCIFCKGLPWKQVESRVLSLQETGDAQKSLLVKLGCSDTGLLPPCQLRCTLLIQHQSESKTVSFLSVLTRWHSTHRSTCVHWNQKPRGTYQTKRRLPRKLRNLFSKRVEDWNLYNCCIPFLKVAWLGVFPDHAIVSSFSQQYAVWVP